MPAAGIGQYLNDHRAGAVAGRRLARRLMKESAGTACGPELAEVVRQIEEDTRTLDQVRSALGVGGGWLRRMAATGADLALKLWPGAPTGSRGIDTIEEFETLIAGVAGKARLWAALTEVGQRWHALEGFDFPQLERRAQGQLAALNKCHLQVVRAELGPDAGQDAAGLPKGVGSVGYVDGAWPTDRPPTSARSS